MTRFKSEVRQWISCVLFCLASAIAVAADHPAKDPHESLPPTFEEQPWKELGVKIPPYPKDSDLLEIHVDDPGARFQYFIDTATLSVGKDGIVNYTLVARSDSGAKNVAFERMHCSNMKYKIAAYGTSRGAFRPVRNQKWRSIRESSNIRYRRDLWEFYLCDTETRRTRSVKKIIDAIRYYREDRKDKGFL